MPRIKDNVSTAEDRQPAAVYEGPLPPDGTYPCIVRSIRAREASTGTEFFNVFAVLDAKDKEGHLAQFDGAPTWTKVWRTDSDFAKSQRLALYKAIAGKGDVVIDVDDKVNGDPVVTKIGGVNPNGVRAYVQLVTETDPEYGSQQKGLFIYPDPSAKNGKVEETEAEPEPEAEVDVEAEEKPKRTRKTTTKKSNVTPIRDKEEPAAKEEDFDSMSFVNLRKAATKHGIDFDGVSKADLITRLKAKTGGGDSGKKNPQDIHAMTEDERVEFAVWYDEDDVREMSVEDLVEVLVEDKHINPF